MVVNTKGAGKGKVSCLVVQPDGSEVEAEVLENEDGTFDIFYTAAAPGNYVIYVRFGGENIPHSPFNVMVSGCFHRTLHRSSLSSGSEDEGMSLLLHMKHHPVKLTLFCERRQLLVDLCYRVSRPLMRFQGCRSRGLSSNGRPPLELASSPGYPPPPPPQTHTQAHPASRTCVPLGRG